MSVKARAVPCDQSKGLLEAGAILAAGATVAEAVPVANQVVRLYRHPVLGDRVVAKLASDVVGPAVDATMDFLGFDAPVLSPTVGVALHGAPGFPESVLIADPKNARYALAVVKDLNRLGRASKGRAGFAKEGMEALGATLAKSVPQFLPSYFEQCGRIFIAHENPTYAGSMFGKARAAEATYNLPINESQRLAVFLEFAFAGALTAKALDDYAKDLAAQYEPATAFAHFRSLAIQRCRGGLAPWAQMMEVVKRLAKAAKIDVDAAQLELLQELFGSPSLRVASLTFWKSIRALTVERARADAAIRGLLLNLGPQGSFGEWWFEFLNDCGSLDALATLDDSALPKEALPANGPAAWLNDALARYGSKHAALPAVLQAMAPRLVRDGVPIQFHHWSASVDAIDLALELRIPCAPPEYFRGYDFEVASERPLTFLGQSEALRAHVQQAVNSAMHQGHGKAVAARSGLVPFVKDWIEDRVQRVESSETDDPIKGGVIEFAQAIRELVSLDAELLDLAPNARERLQTASAAACAARQLRVGIFSEWCWPALESAVTEICGSKKDNEFSFADSWPELIVFDDRRALVIDHEGLVLEHDLKWTASRWRQQLLFVDGQLFVAWYDHTAGGESSYWSGNPTKVAHEGVDVPYRRSGDLCSLAVTGGGRTLGGRAVQVGDVSAGNHYRVLSDGRNYWVHETRWESGGYTSEYVEIDPKSGKRGRASLPEFAEKELRERMVVRTLDLRPLPSSVTSTPLGTRAGLVGSVVLQDASGHIYSGSNPTQPSQIVRIDGLHMLLPATTDDRFGTFGNAMTLMTWPGREELLLVSANGLITDIERRTLISGSTTWPTLRGATLPVGYWHYLQVRDAAGSAALRVVEATSLEPVMALVEQLVAGAVATGSFDPSEPNAEIDAAVAAALPEVTDLVLRSSVTATIVAATVAAQQLRSWIDGDEHGAAASSFSALSDAEEVTLRKAGAGILHWSYDARLRTQLALMQRAALSNPNPKLTLDYYAKQAISRSGADPQSLLTGVPAILYQALLPWVTNGERADILNYVDTWLASPFSHAENMSCFDVKIVGDADPSGTFHWGADGVAWVIGSGQVDYRGGITFHGSALAFAAAPQILEGVDAVRKTLDPALVTREQVAALVALIRDRGPVGAMSSEAVHAFAARSGRSPAESAVVLGGFQGLLYSQELSKDVRESLGRKAAEMKVAVKSFSSAQLHQYQRALISAMFADPESLWSLSPVEFAERLGDAWVDVFGRDTEIDDTLLASVEKVLKIGWMPTDPRQTLIDIALPSAKFTADVPYEVSEVGAVTTSVPEHQITSEWIRTIVRTALLVANDLPLDSPWRARAGTAIQLLRSQLAKGITVQWGVTHQSNPALMKMSANAKSVAVGQFSKLEVDDVNDMLVTAWHDAQGSPGIWQFFLRTDHYFERSWLRVIAESTPEGASAQWLPTFEWLMSDRAKTFAEHLLRASSAAGMVEHDPRVSVPEVVGEVATSLHLEESAAGLFLQFLTLPEPTSARIREWNGWSSKQLAVATGPLLEKELVVSAKRAGAGRDVFLPGGWLELRSPAIGIEDWKAPMYAITEEAGTKRSSHFGRVLPLDPIPTLFRNAWERWTAEDRPGFQAVGQGLGERKRKK
jgi:hypothetical protein